MLRKASLAAVVSHIFCLLAPSCRAMSASASQTEAQLHSFALVTTPDESVAKDIGRGLVKSKLAACVNIVPKITSIYEWEGKVNEDSEVLMIIKTRTSRIPELTDFVRKHHPYKVCEVISTKIDDGNLPYLQWLTSSVPNEAQ